eukprot:CAMPEP_0197038194 /NCGR_PEP_ID=MMETSP1384-20130603/15171_1 /TAXON_ID=29189 /ORGANISM="Ammonia sp." /LENGTH=304 /DNA_ID=CAMNT_0042468591 /DNA_START=10 /DNA_END=924 /DNA_ORIENTATION=-
MSSTYTRYSLSNVQPSEARRVFASQQYKSSTNGCCDGYLQLNVVIMDKKYAPHFQTFCELNPQPAPLLEVLEPGNPFTSRLANKADIRSCLPKYRIHGSDGTYEECHDITQHWTKDMVTFLLGCSFSFEKALQHNGIAMRHIDDNLNVPMYDTNIVTNNVRSFGKHLVVSMRPIKKHQILTAYKVTQPFLTAHSAPIHFGYPQGIGITNINKPEYGDAVRIADDELPVFWACGVTTQVAVQNALKSGMVKQVITHSPGHMFISDVKIDASSNLTLFSQENTKNVRKARTKNARNVRSSSFVSKL